MRVLSDSFELYLQPIVHPANLQRLLRKLLIQFLLRALHTHYILFDDFFVPFLLQIPIVLVQLQQMVLVLDEISFLHVDQFLLHLDAQVVNELVDVFVYLCVLRLHSGNEAVGDGDCTQLHLLVRQKHYKAIEKNRIIFRREVVKREGTNRLFVCYLLHALLQLMMNCSESEISEGFESSQMIVEEGVIPLRHEYNLRPIDYNPRVLLKTNIERKLPDGINDYFEGIDDQQLHVFCQQPKVEQRQPLQTPFSRYQNNASSFQLVYSKIVTAHIFLNRDENYTSRQISLKHIFKYQQQNYCLLKSVQQSQPRSKKQHLSFDSKFQCGNLLCAYQSTSNRNEYHLFMENDTNRYGYNQWFYFNIRGLTPNTRYKFRILNFRKRFSFFKLGMKPIVYSPKEQARTGNGWKRRGENISYTISPVIDRINNQTNKLYSLNFQIEFEDQHDGIFISSGLPYSYSRLIRSLKQLRQIAEQNQIQWTQKIIAYTLSNNQVPYVILTKPHLGKSKARKKKTTHPQTKPIIVVMARQHPGETNSSFLMQQFMRELVSLARPYIDQLLFLYQFHIFPMINIDGVIYGNFRCDLAGFDLNRVWKNPVKELHPQVYAISQKIAQLSNIRKILFCFDFHTHSKQYNIFSYCCKQDQAQSRVFPYMLSKINERLSFPLCTFGLSKDKMTTARAIIFSMIKTFNVLTIQLSSYAGRIINQTKPFSPQDFRKFASSLIETLHSYLEKPELRREYEEEIKYRLDQLLSYNEGDQRQPSGSDSQPQIDPKQIVNNLKDIISQSTLKKLQNKSIRNQIIELSQRQQSKQDEPTLRKNSEQSSLKIFQKINMKERIQLPRRMEKKKYQILAILKNKQVLKSQEKLSTLKVPIKTTKMKLQNYESKDESMRQRVQTQILLKKSSAKPRKAKKVTESSSLTQFDASDLNEDKAYRDCQQNTKIQTIEEELLSNFGKHSGKLGDKRSNMHLRRMSQIEKVMRMRKRANTLKNIICRENSFNNPVIHDLKIGEPSLNPILLLEKSNLPNKCKIIKLKLNKSVSGLSRQPKGKQKQLQDWGINYKKPKKLSVNDILDCHTSLIGQIWMANHSRYERQLS